MIFKDLAAFKTPKVFSEALVDYKVVWKRFLSPVVFPYSKDVMFLLLHNELPVPEHLFRIGVRQDPYCQYCPGAEIADVEHVFCTCERTRECWSWIRVKILGMCEQGLLSSNWELLNFLLPRTQFEQEVLWLISNFIRFVWTIIFSEDSAVAFDKRNRAGVRDPNANS